MIWRDDLRRIARRVDELVIAVLAGHRIDLHAEADAMHFSRRGLALVLAVRVESASQRALPNAA